MKIRKGSVGLTMVLILFTPWTLAQASSAEINALGKEASKGDQAAVEQLIHQTSSTKVIEYKEGWTVQTMTLGEIATNQLINLFSFSPQEFERNHSITNENVAQLLRAQIKKINYSEKFGCWFLTPLEERSIEYTLEALGPNAKVVNEGFARKASRHLSTVHTDLLSKHDPKILLELCALLPTNTQEMYYDNQIMAKLKELTGFELILKMGPETFLSFSNRDNYHDFYSNFITFWVQQYAQFRWEEEQQLFIHSDLSINVPSTTKLKFDELLTADNNAARTSFFELVNSSTELIWTDYPTAFIHSNLPKDYYKLVEELRGFQAIVGDKNLENRLTEKDHLILHRLREQIFFEERYQLENQLIQQLNNSSISGLEVLGMYFSNNADFQHSISRVVDIYYSRNWPAIFEEDAALLEYISKSSYFFKIRGGSKSNYIVKFENTSATNLNRMKVLTADDSDLSNFVKLIADHQTEIQKQMDCCPRDKVENQQTIEGFRKEVEVLTKRYLPGHTREFEYDLAAKKLPYHLIIESLPLVSALEFPTVPHLKYAYIHQGFGIPVDNLDNDSIRKDFVYRIENHTLQDIYRHYLRVSGFHIWKNNGEMNYKAIQEILYYGLPKRFDDFGEIRENGFYAVIKCLEFEHNRLLAYAGKESKLEDIAPNVEYQRACWIHYLLQKEYFDQEPGSSIQWRSLY
jgi:hypothetical protein